MDEYFSRGETISPGRSGQTQPDANAGLPVNRDTLLKYNRILADYKAGKSSVERRIVNNEQWWKLRNAEQEKHEKGVNTSGQKFKPQSAWLHNSIVTKHADAMDNYPEPLVLPREPGDKDEAKMLTSILPMVFEEVGFEEVYSSAWWRKLKYGTAIYQVTWDADALNGLGDICIRDVDPLSVFWEPGVTDIQKSKYFFHCELRDNDELEAEYPQLKGKLGRSYFNLTKYRTDDTVKTDHKSMVIDVYYKQRQQSGRTVVHYVKYVNDELLVSTENDSAQRGYQFPAQGTRPVGNVAPMPQQQLQMPQQGGVQTTFSQQPSQPFTGMAALDGSSDIQQQTMPQAQPGNANISVAPQAQFSQPEPAESEGIYDDGMYPFVFDALFPVEGSPCGYGYIDLSKSAQTQIDLMDAALVSNMLAAATPRYFIRGDGSVNEKEMLDLTKPFVHTNGNLGDDSIKPMAYQQVGSYYTTIYSNKISELRETSGNTETANGISTQGVTSAAGIAALQEASGKSSRDQSKASYRAYRKIVNMVIERIRQFYDAPRQFRITGQFGEEQFVTYDNSNLKPQWQGGIGQTDLGYKLPVFDIKIEVAKKTSVTRTSQNDLALQFYNLGFFNPQFTDQALNCLEMMDFDGKDALMQRIQQNGSMFQTLQQLSQYVVALLQKYEPANAPAMAESLGMQTGAATAMPEAIKGSGTSAMTSAGEEAEKESNITAKSRARAAQASST